jgi:hypothetical protein
MEVRRSKRQEDVPSFTVGPADHRRVVPSEMLQLESLPKACAEDGMYEMCVLALPVLSTDGRGGSSRPAPVC